MENENEIAQILRDILAVLQDSNERAKQNFADIKQRTDDARERASAAQERSDKRIDAITQEMAGLSKQNTSKIQRSMRGSMVAVGILVLLILVEMIIRSL